MNRTGRTNCGQLRKKAEFSRAQTPQERNALYRMMNGLATLDSVAIHTDLT